MSEGGQVKAEHINETLALVRRFENDRDGQMTLLSVALCVCAKGWGIEKQTILDNLEGFIDDDPPVREDHRH